MRAIYFHRDRAPTSPKGTLVIHLAFMLLFPGFFFYQTLIGLGVVGAFLGGYFTLVALVLTPFLMFFHRLAVVKRKRDFSELDFYCLVFVSYISLLLGINFAAGADTMIVLRYIQSLIFCIDTYILFSMIDLNDRDFIVLATVCLILMSVITIYFSIDGFFYLQALDESKDPDSVATYQGFARSYIYTYLIVIATAKSLNKRLLIYGLAISCLFLNGARSEFVGALLLIPIVELYYMKQKLLPIIAFFLFAWVLAMNAESIVNLLPDNRTLQLLDLSHSSSAIARQQLSSAAWQTIMANPLFGDFASYPDGHYSHNILSVWVDFGLIGILFFAALLIYPASRLFANGFFSKTKSGDFVLAGSLICIAIFWVLTSKNAPDMSIGAALGAFAKYRFGKDHKAA